MQLILFDIDRVKCNNNNEVKTSESDKCEISSTARALCCSYFLFLSKPYTIYVEELMGCNELLQWMREILSPVIMENVTKERKPLRSTNGVAIVKLFIESIVEMNYGWMMCRDLKPLERRAHCDFFTSQRSYS